MPNIDCYVHDPDEWVALSPGTGSVTIRVSDNSTATSGRTTTTSTGTAFVWAAPVYRTWTWAWNGHEDGLAVEQANEARENYRVAVENMEEARRIALEQSAARQEENRRYNEEQARLIERRREERREAHERADNLLREYLDEEQLADFEENQAFNVVVGDRRYRIGRGRVGNVTCYDIEDRVRSRYCIHPQEVLPDGDQMLAQKLLLETDHEQFLQIANVA